MAYRKRNSGDRYHALVQELIFHFKPVQDSIAELQRVTEYRTKARTTRVARGRKKSRPSDVVGIVKARKLDQSFPLRR